MKKMPSIYKWLLLILINTIPFVLNVIFYKHGVTDDMYLYLPVLFILTILNFLTFKKTPHYIIMQMYIIVCIFFSGYADTYLYFHNISDDSMTPLVGMITVFAEIATVLIVIVITAIVKAIINKNRAKKTNN